MKYSVGVEYGLHSLIYMVRIDENIRIKDLAAFQGISESYLSKIFAKLAKEDIVKSVPGVKGGYVLGRDPKDISFWDVLSSIEGSGYFRCKEIRQSNILVDSDNLPDTHTKCPCFIKVVMDEGENKMKEYLSSKSMRWLYEKVYESGSILSSDDEKAMVDWFKGDRQE